MPSNTRRHVAAVAIAALLPGFFSPASAQAPKEIRIAQIHSLTGPLEAYGKQAQTGFQLGLEYATGGTMGIFADLTVKENLVLAARGAATADALDKARLEWVLSLFAALKKFWLYPAGKLSGGQKQMLAIARAIIEPRDLLLIDEPSKGLAPAMVRVFLLTYTRC